jgi:hypothetical protein
MATIKLSDQFGLDINAQPAERSALLKYFQQLPALRFDSLDLSKVGGLTLDQPAVEALSSGLSFEKPVDLGEGAPALSVAAGAHASFAVITDVSDLPGHDDPVDNLANTCYVSFGIQATVSTTLSVPSGALQFGASPSTTVNLVSCSRFPLHAGVTLTQAIGQTVAAFAVPAHSADLADLPAGQITSAAVRGKLKLSGTADLLATANPLASASLPAPLPAVSVSAGGSVTVGVALEIEAEYELVARKLDSGAVRLGWFHKNKTEVSVHAEASEGITAGLGGTDLFSQIIGVISASPQADLKELAGAGVPDELAAGIQAAVKAAANRKLEIAVGAAFSTSEAHAATFLYEIVPAALTADSRQAVDRALAGDLTALHAPGIVGVSCVRSVWDNVRKSRVELDVNLLGILNYRSVARLSLEGKVMFEPATGALVIADSASAERIRSTQVNFGADTQKLRRVLAESFLITAAYHGAKQLAGGVSLRCSHNFFELQNATSRGDMARKLRTGVALGLLSADEAAPPAGAPDFGRTLFSAATDYDDGLAQRMFLDGNEAPLAREWYETAGRSAIQFLVAAGDQDDVRRRPAVDDTLWKRMKEVGQPGIPSLFLGVAVPLVAAITADYTTIQWWADAMSGTAQKLADVRLWLKRNPGAAAGDPAFEKVRQDLAAHLRDVAANTREEFGQPWGLIAMNQLAGRNAGAKMLISGPLLVLDKRRALAAGTGL